MADLVNVPLGEFGAIKLADDGKGLELSIAAKISHDQLLTMVENAIPGDVDNKLIDGLKAIIAKV